MVMRITIQNIRTEQEMHSLHTDAHKWKPESKTQIIPRQKLVHDKLMRTNGNRKVKQK